MLTILSHKCLRQALRAERVRRCPLSPTRLVRLYFVHPETRGSRDVRSVGRPYNTHSGTYVLSRTDMSSELLFVEPAYLTELS